MDLVQKSRQLPTSPGVYVFKNPEGEVIYVGKAKDLRARVRTYFLPESWTNAKTGSLVREAAELESIVVDTEAEALALENTLIKEHQPRFNILLRDDKTYPYIRLSRETYPRVYVTRRLEKDGSEYFGPFFPAGFAYRMVNFVHRHFLVPSCKVDLTRFHPRPCLQFHIQRCLGPCVQGLTTPDAYQRAVADTRLFLSGRQADLARDLKARRDAAAAAENFEEAAKWRDLLTVLDEAQERQKMHAVTGADADIIGFHREDERIALNLFHFRHGRMVDRREFFWEALPDAGLAPGREDATVLGALLKQVYLASPYLPPSIAVPFDFEDRDLLEVTLSAQRGTQVEIAVPQRGTKKAMIELAARNATHSFARRFRSAPPDEQARTDWQALSTALGLDLGPEPGRIECFDISHFQGAETVAAMVVYAGARMDHSQYRRFKIKTVAGVDDFRSIEEVVRRRYRRRLDEGTEMPALILIDGGLGQLHAAQRALDELGLDHLPLASLAKREELVYISRRQPPPANGAPAAAPPTGGSGASEPAGPNVSEPSAAARSADGGEAEPLRLDPHLRPLQTLQMIRDEAHRFAITFHRERRGKALTGAAGKASRVAGARGRRAAPRRTPS